MALRSFALAALALTSPSGTSAVSLRSAESFNPFKGLFAETTQAPFGCRKPKDDEKLVYLVVHAEAEDGSDGVLTSRGEEQARALRSDPRLQLALSQDPQRRVGAVIMAPSRKAMQTAMLGFRDVLPDAAWDIDPDIKGQGAQNQAVPELGKPMLKQLGASVELLSKYSQHYDHQHMGKQKERFSRFVSHLYERPEKNIIVVTTEYEAHLAGAELSDGEARIFALANDPLEADENGAFRMLSKPQRWPECPEVTTRAPAEE